MGITFITGNPYGFPRFMRTIQDNGFKLTIYFFFFWRLAKWGTEDARELLKKIDIQNRYLDW